MPASQALAESWPYPRQKPFVAALQEAATAWFATRGLRTRPQMSYCLDQQANWAGNIILEDVVRILRQEQDSRIRKDAFPLHTYLHHGLSSQAMLFNLVGPLLTRQDFEPIKAACDVAGVPWPEGNITPKLEAYERAVFNEDSGQPTSIDLVITGERGAPLYIEAKLVEQEFGGSSVFTQGDCEGQNPVHDLSSCYLHHLGRRYWLRMRDHGFLVSPLVTGPICPFASYYQFFREVLFAVEKGGHLILLHDERNPVFIRKGVNASPTRGLWPFLTAAVPPRLRGRLHALTIQVMVRVIEASGRHNDWIVEFKEKYGLYQEMGI